MAENLHKDHRKRMRQELIAQDFPDSMSDHKVLEVLLYYGIPQKDTNELAHRLINTFGSLTAVLEADSDSLFQISGMTERAVVLIKLILPFCRRYTAQAKNKTHQFASVEQMCEYLVKMHHGFGKEVFILTSLNAMGNVIDCDVISKGDSTNVTFEVRDVVQKALIRKAVYVVVSHNHLTDNLIPSKADIDSTKRLAFTLGEMGIKLLDHIIISGNEYVSMVKDNYIATEV